MESSSSENHSQRRRRRSPAVIDLADDSDEDIEVLQPQHVLTQEERDAQFAAGLQEEFDREAEEQDGADIDGLDDGMNIEGLVRQILMNQNAIRDLEMELADFGSESDEEPDGKERDVEEEAPAVAPPPPPPSRYNLRNTRVRIARRQTESEQLPIDPPRRRRRPPPPRRRRGGGPPPEMPRGPMRFVVGNLELDLVDGEVLIRQHVNRGATVTQIRTLPTSKYRKPSNPDVTNDDSKKCLICLEGFKTGDSIRTLPCFHVFHEVEIDRWLRQNIHCPICREPIRP